MNPWVISGLVGVGGMAGSLARYGLTVASQRFALEWPLGTLAANVLGCLLIGLIAGLSERGGLSPELRLALATGFCGGFTTMSSLVYEAAEMLRAGEVFHAAWYAGGTLVLGLAAFAAGNLGIRWIIRMGGGLWN